MTSFRVPKPAAEVTPGTWLARDDDDHAEVTYVQAMPRPHAGTLIVYADGTTDTFASDRSVVYLSTDGEIAAAKSQAARESIFGGLVDLAHLYRDARMPLPSYRCLIITDWARSEAELRSAAKVLDVEVTDEGDGTLLAEWASSSDEKADRVMLVLRAACGQEQTPAEVEGPSAGTAGPGEEPATAPAGEETPAGAATLDQTRVDHDTAAILGEVRATGRASVGPFHVGRAPAGLLPEERDCGCPVAPCGLIDNTRPAPGCTEHNGRETYRQMHAADRCTGGTR